MTKKELSQLYYLEREIYIDKQRLLKIKDKAYSLSGSNLSGMPGNNSLNRGNIERYAADIADLEAIIEAKIKQCTHERNRLERYISNIDDSLTRQVFTLRYVDGMSWTKVAIKVGGYNTADSVRMICNRYIEKENKKAS